LLPILTKLPLPSLRRSMIGFIPLPALHMLQDLVDLMDASATEIVRNRRALTKNGQLDAKDNGRDLMSLFSIQILLSPFGIIPDRPLQRKTMRLASHG
jgi:hypothetical protein